MKRLVVIMVIVFFLGIGIITRDALKNVNNNPSVLLPVGFGADVLSSPRAVLV